MQPKSLASTDACELPVDVNVSKAVGADDWGANAQQAVRLAKQWSDVAMA